MVDEREASAPSGAETQLQQPHSDVYTVANVITVLRLILIPIFFTAILSDRPHSDTAAFILFVLAASTDWLDGMIARRTGTVTQLGKALDPLVDRLLIASGVLGLYVKDRLPLWIVLLLILRDVYLLYGAWVLEKHHRRLAVTYTGKVTTAVLLSGFSLLILYWPVVSLGGRTFALGELVVYAGVVLSVITAVQYTFIARRTLAEARTAEAGAGTEEEAAT